MKKLILLFSIVFLFSKISSSQTWVQKLSGISMWSMAKDLQGNLYCGTSGTPRAIYKSIDGGNNWNAILSNGVTNFLSIAVDSLGNIYSANVSNGLVKSTDGGNNWITIPISTFNGKNVESVACGRNGYVYVGCISGGIFRSTDYGNTFPDTAIATGTFVTMYVDRYNSNIIFAGASATTGIIGLFRSTDRGLTYTATPNINTVWGLVQKTPAEMYMATTTTGYPFTKSTDDGITWTTVGSQPGAMRGMTLDAAGNIYICGNGGVYKSTNGGVGFTNMNLTYSGNQVISYQNKILAAISGTANGGVWIYTDSTISGISGINTNTPDKFCLYQNYPNPFNPVTNINYQINKYELVTLKIYDFLGREITTLVNEFKSPGCYNLNWDASGYPSGIYFYKISSGKFSNTKKMILLK